MQKHAKCLDLVKRFPTNIQYLRATNRRRYSRERASQKLEVIQFIFSIHSLLGFLFILFGVAVSPAPSSTSEDQRMRGGTLKARSSILRD